MRRALTCIVICLAALAACEDNPAGQYGSGLTNAYTSSKVAGKAADIDVIQRSIDTYKVSNEKYPPTMKDVSALMGKDLDPELYSYDPDTGRISAK